MSSVAQESLTVRAEFERKHQLTIREEIEIFREKSQAFLRGEITDNDFRPFRLKHGIYGQRQAGVQMVRCKIPGGLLTADQVDQFARIAEEYGGGKGHFTTRQNMQYHFVPLSRVPEVMHLLADVGLTNREACYNTVRNVTACPYAGLSRHEVFDVRPYAQRIAYAFLRKDLTGNLPRKFKIAFEGCADHDHIKTHINDIGLRAQIRDGKRGFSMVIGGGLGSLPTEAQFFEEFIPEDQLIHKCEAVIRVFNKYGCRTNKMKARMKFVLRERGIEWMRDEIGKGYADILANGGIQFPEMVPEGFGGYQSEPQPLGTGELLPVLSETTPEYDHWLETNIVEQQQTGYATVVVRLEQGNISAEQMHGLAKISRDAADGLVRVGIDQNVLIGFVPLARLRGVYAALGKLGLNTAAAGEVQDITTCPGAYSCNLGLTKSMNLGAALQEVVAKYDDPLVRQLSIKISGCPNSCGQHWISDFGFYGNARKIDGKEVPYYQMLLGGGYDSQGMMRFGLAVQSIPARLAPAAVRRVLDHYIANRQGGESFRDYVLRHKVEFFRGATADLAKPTGDPEMLLDWGDDQPFSLKLGRGECAA